MLSSKVHTLEKMGGIGVRSHEWDEDERITMRLSEFVELQIESLELGTAETSLFQL